MRRARQVHVDHAVIPFIELAENVDAIHCSSEMRLVVGIGGLL